MKATTAVDHRPQRTRRVLRDTAMTGARDESSVNAQRRSWSARFSAVDASHIERGCALTHCGVASRFVERAFIDHAAALGSIKTAGSAPLVVAESRKKTVENLILVQSALAARLSKSTSTFIARQTTIDVVSQYLKAGDAKPTQLAPTPPPGPLPAPLNLRLLPVHLDLLTEMAGAKDEGRIDVLSAAIRRQVENIGLDDKPVTDEFGVPSTWVRYPHPELLSATNTIEDTLLALLVAYRSISPLKASVEWAISSTELHKELSRIKLRKIVDE